jgi:hypothetical protein
MVSCERVHSQFRDPWCRPYSHGSDFSGKLVQGFEMDLSPHDTVPVEQRPAVLKQTRAICQVSGLLPPSNQAITLAEGRWARGEIDDDEWRQALDDYVAWVWGSLR